MVVINGKKYSGNSVSVMDNKVFIDGKRVDQSDDEKVINIVVEGNINSLEVDSCEKLEVTGNCGNVASKNGNIRINGDVSGDVTNKNGDIDCFNVGGDVSTKNGDVHHT